MPTPRDLTVDDNRGDARLRFADAVRALAARAGRSA